MNFVAARNYNIKKPGPTRTWSIWLQFFIKKKKKFLILQIASNFSKERIFLFSKQQFFFFIVLRERFLSFFHRFKVTIDYFWSFQGFLLSFTDDDLYQ